MEFQQSYLKNPERWCYQSVPLNMSANLEKQQWPQNWKRSILIPVPKKGSNKECSSHQTVALISHTSKVMLKILHARFSIMWTENFQMSKLGLEKAEEPEVKLTTFTGPSRKQGHSRKTSTFVPSAMLKSLPVWIIKTCGKLLNIWEYQPSYLSPKKSICWSRSNSYNLVWNKWLVPDWERSIARLFIVTLFI